MRTDEDIEMEAVDMGAGFVDMGAGFVDMGAGFVDMWETGFVGMAILSISFALG